MITAIVPMLSYAAPINTSDDNLTWTLDNDGVLTISGVGDMRDYLSASSMPWYSNRTKIKKVIIESGITSIGEYAFSEHHYITEVQIPDTVTKISDHTFYRCDAMKTVSIPDSIRYIGVEAFYGCKSLPSVSLGSNIATIGNCAFQGCKSLTSVSVPFSVSVMGDHVFAECTGLEQVNIPSSIKKISDYAFWNCTSLVDVTIPDSVTAIDNHAFWACSELKNITIGSGVKEIGKSAFSDCKKLKNVYYCGSEEAWKLISIGADNALLQSAAIYYNASSSIRVTLNGEPIPFDQAPVIVNDRTMVPLRAIFEALGASVDWDGATQTVTSKLHDTTIKMSVGSKLLYRNNAPITLDVAAQLINERTMVPVRAIAEAFDCAVGWDGATQTVSITK